MTHLLRLNVWVKRMDSSINRSVRLVLVGGFSALFLIALVLQRDIFPISLAIILILPLTWGLYQLKDTMRLPITLDFGDSVGFALGALLTYGLHSLLDWPVVMASGLVGLLGFFLFKPYAVPIFAGSFLGMSDSLLLGFDFLWLALIVGALVYALLKPTIVGFGGRLGFIAWVASMSVFLLRYPLFEPAARIGFDPLIFYFGTVFFGVMTFWLQRQKDFDAVSASALIGVLLGLLALPQFATWSAYAIPWYGATFVGMSSHERFPKVWMWVIPTLLYGVLFYLIHPYYPFTGGKLGALSFISALASWCALQKIVKKP